MPCRLVICYRREQKKIDINQKDNETEKKKKKTDLQNQLPKHFVEKPLYKEITLKEKD